MNSASIEQQTIRMSGSLMRTLRNLLYSYVQLTKPRIIMLFSITGIAAQLIEGSLRSDPFRFWMIALGTLLTAGSANALNQYIDRDIDAVMDRTKKKRPIPMGLIHPTHALIYATLMGIVATWILYRWGNLHAAFWGFFTIAFYVGVYTLWLKRTTPHNIVIGGAAGATAPLIAWAAATGHLSWTAWSMFLVIFLWTPPHFWALALCVKDEYAGVSVPMLPVVAGEAATIRQIVAYSVLVVPCTLVPYFTHYSGKLYFGTALLLGAEFLRRAYLVAKVRERSSYWKMFGYSIAYLLVLYVVMMIDVVVK